MRTLIPVFVFILLVGSEQTNAQNQPLNRPIELPEFIVTGTSRVDIPGSSKQAPARPPLLNAALLDSLNPLEKLALPSLPEAPLPSYSQPFPYWPGHVRATFGNYLTPNVDVGYTFDAGGYLIDVTAGAEATNGWTPNSDYIMYHGGLRSTFVAPEKFVFFGGSTTTADVHARKKDFQLYALDGAPNRSIGEFAAGVKTVGASNGIKFSGSANFMGTSINDNSGTLTADNSFKGFVGVHQQFDALQAGVSLDVRLRGFAGKSYPYTSAYASGDYVTSFLRVQGDAGVQLAGNTTEVSRFGVLIHGEGAFFLSPSLTVNAYVHSGLQPLEGSDLLEANPYMSRKSEIEAPYDLFRIGGSIMVHPVVRVIATAGIELAQTERDAVWVPAEAGLFAPDYRTTSTFKLFGDLRWIASAQDVLVADISVVSASVSDAKTTPYVPSFKASVGHTRDWSEKVSSTLALIYVGDRFADIENNISLSGYLDLRAKAAYAVSNALSIELQAQNLLGSTIVIWNGYRERDIFITGGILWKF